jgi:hypothetical protein
MQMLWACPNHEGDTKVEDAIGTEQHVDCFHILGDTLSREAACLNSGHCNAAGDGTKIVLHTMQMGSLGVCS